MSWNYRVVHRVHEHKSGVIEHTYGIHEAYYKVKGQETPHMISTEAVCPLGETVEELKADIALYLKALDCPVVEYEDI